MSIGCAVLMCHAPIVVPPIAGARAGECSTTTRAMREAAQTLVAHAPELIVLLSPHAPRLPGVWGISYATALSGSFARFGHDALAYVCTGAPDAARCLADEAHSRGLATHDIGGALDHGALVPLHFVQEAGYHGPVLLVALPFPGADSEVEFGRAIDAASARMGRRWAVLASGDMSHRLTRDAPSGFDPLARTFDSTFVSHLRRGDIQKAVSLDVELAERAAEDVVQSTATALGAIGNAQGTRVIAYEGPFGVGYCEALLHSDHAHELSTDSPPAQLVTIAHDAIHAALSSVPYTPPALASPWDKARPVFVTLRSYDGELRGCIGRVEPVEATLSAEVAECAVSAATRDYRMPPVDASELSELSIEVSVLGPREPVKDVSELDPHRFGVVVSHGPRRGVLLPHVQGVNDAAEQLSIALRKGGIGAREPYRIERFLVSKVERPN
jgi:AmmeMemoRadiSam system protein A